MDLLDEIRRNIALIQADNGFSACKTVIFGANKPTEKMISLLRAANIEPVCVIDNNPGVIGRSICEVRIMSPEEGIRGIEKNVRVLIASRYYDEMKNQLVRLGCREDRIHQMAAYGAHSSEQADFDKAVGEIYSGYQCHQRLLAEFGEKTHIIQCPYSGIGDVYIVGAYLKAYCAKMGYETAVVTVISNNCMTVAEMFETVKVKKLEPKDSYALMKYALYMGQENVGISVLHTHAPIHRDILINFEKTDRLSWGKMFLRVVMGLDICRGSTPVYKSAAHDKAWKFMSENKLCCGKTAVISPYATTVISLDDSIWKQIIDCLKNKGYMVYTNSTGNKEPAIDGTLPIKFPIEIAAEVVGLAGVFVGVRSGLCDAIENAQAKIFVLYPDNRQMFFSLKEMGFGQNVREIDCGQEDVKTVLEEEL